VITSLLFFGGLDLDSSEDNEHSGIEWSDLAPSAHDRHQDYVFIAHFILAIIISILSFSGGLVSWAFGTGVITPILLFATGVTYGIVTGINWYRDEFIPHLCQTRMIPEFEVDRFLNYKRWHRRTILVSGYLTTAISQVVWLLITSLGVTTETITIIFLLSMLLALMVVVYLIVLFVWLFFFEYLLKLIFSDVDHIIKIDDERVADYQARKKEEKEEEND
jgi:hypothetical protein